MPDTAPRAASAAAEGLLTALRTAELQHQPVEGRFDKAHLQEIHRRLFQDLPHFAPGMFRIGSAAQIKLRVLETSGHRYRVHYGTGDAIEPGLDRQLATAQALVNRHDLTLADFSRAMAELYAQLDYLHPFHEGNSRTLRVFTRQLAATMGYDLHWGTKDADGLTRDRLYVARDKAVTLIAFPGLNLDKAMRAETRAEEAAYLEILAKYRKGPSLESFIEQTTRAYPAPAEDEGDHDDGSAGDRPRG